MVTLVTHDGKFHTDDVFACAILSLVHKHVKIIRSRDTAIIHKADIAVDVGDTYSHAKKRYDHHQKSFTQQRDNGVPYASAGLIWKHYGRRLTSRRVWQDLDDTLFSSIDAGDNGISLYERTEIPPYDLSSVINSFLPAWNKGTHHHFYQSFLKAVSFASGVLEREIAKREAKISAEKQVRKVLRTANKDYVVFEEYLPATSIVVRETNLKFIVFKDMHSDKWYARTVPTQEDSFEARAHFPKSWAGLTDEALVKASGVSDAIFCHKGRFLVAAKSKKGAIALVEQALGKK